VPDGRARPTRWTVKQRHHALELYRAGFSPRDVERLTGVPTPTLQVWRKKAGIPADRKLRATPRTPEPLRTAIVRLHERGLTPREIGALVGRHENTVSYHLRREGRQRTISEALRLAWKDGRRYG